jgi:N-acetylglucosamine kinase-like BadF-type ATPase
MSRILGVDGGNSKTLAVVGDEQGLIVGVSRVAGSNHQGHGLEEAVARVRAAGEEALQMAGLRPQDVDAAYYALAGADLPEDFEMLRPALQRLPFGEPVGLNNDSMASLRSGSDNPNAVVVGWGSGVNGMGRNARGEEIRLPALGDISGDWGGGGDLAREAIWVVAWAHDGRGEPTMLTELVLEALDVSDVDEMIRKLYHHNVRPYSIYRLAPLVFQAAGAGDAVASDLVKRAGVEVAVTALALLKRLGLLETPADVVLGGSVFRTDSPLLFDTIRQRVKAGAPLAQIVVPDIEPVLGAYFCGLDMLQIPVDPRVRARAKQSYETLAPRPAEARAS